MKRTIAAVAIALVAWPTSAHAEVVSEPTVEPTTVSTPAAEATSEPAPVEVEPTEEPESDYPYEDTFEDFTYNYECDGSTQIVTEYRSVITVLVQSWEQDPVDAPEVSRTSPKVSDVSRYSNDAECGGTDDESTGDEPEADEPEDVEPIVTEPEPADDEPELHELVTTWNQTIA